VDILAPSHLLIILILVLVIFGPNKLGEVGSALGRAVRDFKSISREGTEIMRNPPTDIESQKPSSEKDPAERS
jgi:sec-independent protein translocase protein TatA